MDSLVPLQGAAAMPAGSGSSGGSGFGIGAGMDVARMQAVLRRRALPILGCVLLGAAGAYFVASTIPKSYTASGAVAVAGDRMAIPELEGALRADNQPDPFPEVHTEMMAMLSRQLVQQVATELHLERDPEFNANLRAPGLLARIKDGVKSWLPHGTGGKAVDGTGDALFGAVNRALVISQDNRSLVIGIAFTSEDPALSARFVNTLITDYIQTRNDRRTHANEGASTVMAQRVDQVRADIEAIEARMRDLRTKAEAVGLPAGSVGQQQVEDLANAASRASLERSQVEAQWTRAAALASSGSSDALASVLGSETISRLREQESQASAKVADLSMRYGPAWPALRSAEADLSATRRQIASESSRIVSSLATQLRVARAHEADMNAQLASAQRKGAAAQNVQSELTQLQQDAATRRDLYRTLLERAEQTRTGAQRDELPDVRVISRAVVPGLPSAPNVKAATGFGGLGGGLLACALALAFTRREDDVLTPASLARLEGLPVVATLRGRSALAGGGRQGLAARVAAAPSGVETDAMRVARTRLGQIARRVPRKIAFVAARNAAAAAAAAAGFARAAAMDGQRVLLLQADDGANDLARALNAPAGRLDERLAGALDWRDAVVADSTPGLDLLLGGGGMPRSQVALENLLVEAATEYALIVLGTPVAAQADAVSLARSCDATVLVVVPQDGVTATLAARTRIAPMARGHVAAIAFLPG